ncbi:MAG: prepilin-type N-terminal cleavage/methylation domain-containing protein, partial [bacterium]|nr:prepilin-type N-terminal cleavage/methylation domain-containing protein [bacterium]
MRNQIQARRLLAVTLIEMLVVVLIIGILATIATGVYSGETRRAKVAATEALLKNLEIAIARYEVDTGTLPPSGSGSALPPEPLDSATPTPRNDGSGYLYVALVHSMSGNANQPASPSWDGPYINIPPLKSPLTM